MILLLGEEVCFLPYFNYQKKKKKDQNISLVLLPSEADFSGKFTSLSHFLLGFCTLFSHLKNDNELE